MKKAGSYLERGFLWGMLSGVGVSAMMCLLGAAVLAWLMVFEKLDVNAMEWGTGFLLAIASALGSWTAWKRIGANRLAVWVAHSGLLFCVLLIGALPFGSGFTGLGTNAICILLGGGTVCIPALFGNRSGGKAYRKMAFR